MARKRFQGRAVGTWITLGIVALAFAPLAVHAVRGKAADVAGLPLDAPLPLVVPKGTTLVVGDPLTQKVLQHNGWLKDLPFKIQFAEISGGPAVTEAFQAKALDVGSAANIPPIHAVWVGIPVKIVAFRLRKDPINFPTYVIGVAPKAKIASVADLRGKRIAYSPGQAQGAVVLQTLDDAKIPTSAVTLVDLPAGADTYIGALAANAVDAAPLGRGLQTGRYLDHYAGDGARTINHGAFRDDPGLLYVRTETLKDPAKAAAIRQYVQLWARAQQWIDEHPKEWGQLYYVHDQGLSPADADRIIRETGRRDVPRGWDGVIALQQTVVDFMAREMKHPAFDAHDIFDRRFETIAADATGPSAGPRQASIAR